MPPLEAQLGKSVSQNITLTNCSNGYITVKYENSNPLCFDIKKPQGFQIPPMTKEVVTVVYKPSDIDCKEMAEIDFMSNKIGTWHYFFTGYGTNPENFNTKVIRGSIDKDFRGRIFFKNPYKYRITV